MSGAGGDDDAPLARRPGHDGDDARLVRAGNDKGLTLGEKVAAGVRRIGYATALHRIRLRGHFPLKLLAVPIDPHPGDRGIGEKIVAGRLPHGAHNAAARTVRFDDPAAPAAWRDWANSFAWLRDLATATDRVGGAKVAEPLMARWLAAHAEFNAAVWRADLVGLRLLYWTAYAPYILSSADLVYRSAVLNVMARSARHLDRAVDKLPDGPARVTATCGLVVAGLLIPGGDGRLAHGEALLARALDAVLLDDGGIVSRSPYGQLELLELLLFVKASYDARAMQPPTALAAAVARLVPAIKSVAMGDGGLGHWHGGSAARPERVERALKLSGVMARPPRAAGASGYQRLAAGSVILVADAGPPPVARAAALAHAGTLAFELSDGLQRLVVNCGGSQGLPRPLDPELAAALRTTAAHSTLILADTNSTRIRSDGALGRGVEEVVANRQESEEGSWLDLRHDGYVRRFGVRHIRRLFLSADGNDLRGEDTLEAVGDRRRRAARSFDVRFHLGAGVEATPTGGGMGALLKLPDGRLWQFKVRGGTLAIDDSLWIDLDGKPRATQQLVLSSGGDGVNWSFKRAGH